LLNLIAHHKLIDRTRKWRNYPNPCVSACCV
jgi:hypothetical protein